MIHTKTAPQVEVELVPESEMEYFPEISFVYVLISRIRPLTWNRRTNHVIAFLDDPDG